MSRNAAFSGTAILLGLALLSNATLAFAQTESGHETVLSTIVAEQVTGEAAFDVTAYTTVVDGDNQPIPDLGLENFSLSEDGAPVTIAQASPATQPSHIVLVLDTSGSMAFQGKVEAVQAAATRFVENLGEEDQVAIIAFNESADILKELSADHLAAASIIDLLSITPASGTCLYDAAYKATILSTTAPQGRRAVVLLTDGVDELPNAPGEACSEKTVDDVIALASGGTTRSPIYTIGVGNDVNADELARIASQTGGRSALAANSSLIDDLFEAVGQQLNDQYALTYRSTATSGEQHSLAVTMTLDGVASVDQRAFILPEPALLIITGLIEGDLLSSGSTTMAVANVTGGAEVSNVRFSLDGEPIGTVTTPPFEFNLAANDLQAGGHSLTVEAELVEGQRLIRNVLFEIEPPPPVPTEVPPPLPPAVTEAPTSLLDFARDNPLWLAFGGFVVVGLAVLGLLAARLRPTSIVAGGAGAYSGPEDLTRSLRIDDVLGMLTVRESPGLLPGQPFDISETPVRLGSSADSDIVVPDEPVSRQHAEIHVKDDTFYIVDLGSEHGTRVNGERVGPDGLLLQTGDLIALGSQTTFAFSAFQASTFDTNPVGALADFSQDIYVEEDSSGLPDEASDAPKADSEYTSPAND